MNDANCHLRCERYVANPNGSVRLYILEVIDAEGAESLEILVTPRELVSLSSMKRILCGKRVFIRRPRCSTKSFFVASSLLRPNLASSFVERRRHQAAVACSLRGYAYTAASLVKH